MADGRRRRETKSGYDQILVDPHFQDIKDTNEVVRSLKGTKAGKNLRTILGGDIEHVFREKAKLREAISSNTLAAGVVFGGTKQFFGSTGGFGAVLAQLRALGKKATAGTLTDTEAKFLEDQTKFSTDEGKFRRLLSRRNEVVKAREEVESTRRRSPGRTQTILTRREG